MFHLAVIIALPTLLALYRTFILNISFYEFNIHPRLQLLKSIGIGILGCLIFGLLFGSLFAAIQLRNKSYESNQDEMLDDFEMARPINIQQFYAKSILRTAAIAAVVIFLNSLPSIFSLLF